MSTVDTLQVSKDLQTAEFSPVQADALARLLRARQESDLTQLVTKEFLDARMTQLEQRMTITLGGMLVIAVGVIAALVKLL
jgi:hypothetical protein